MTTNALTPVELCVSGVYFKTVTCCQ